MAINAPEAPSASPSGGITGWINAHPTAALIGAVIIAMRENTPLELLQKTPAALSGLNGEIAESHPNRSHVPQLRADVGKTEVNS